MLAKLVSLVKPGGHLLLFGIEVQGEGGYFVVGDENFSNVGPSLEFAMHAMVECGMEIVTTKLTKDVWGVPKVGSFNFIHGKKVKNFSM